MTRRITWTIPLAVCSGVAATLLTLLVASLTGVASLNLGPSHHFGELARDRDSWHSRDGLLYTVTAARMATSDQRDRDHLEFEVVVINDSSHYREDTLPEVRCEAGGEEHEATAGAELPQSGLHPSEGAFGASAVLEFSCPVPSGTDREHVAVSLLADGRKMEFTDPLNSSSRVLRGEGRDGLW
ncbi:hypothetical protein ABZ635_25130 [Nocardiopsis sp. NPDC007018]|uniref:hypothetical protein n=1 Tax=Nocardiopsis sp. NPDC007018 TaxID=3155721 RepID=UPI0033C8F910